MPRTALCFTGLMLVANVSGCLFTTDLERFEQLAVGNGSPDCDNPNNVCLRLTDFAARATQLGQADVVTDDFLRARAIFDPIEADGDVDVILPMAVLDADLLSGAAFDVQLLADDNDDGDVEDNDDATWVARLPPSGNLEITDGAANADLDRPRELDGDFTMTFTGMTAHAGQLLEVWIQEAATGRTAGYYRLAQVPDSGDLDIAIPGIIGETGSRYRVQFYADFDENGGYEPRAGNPAGDHSWVRTVTADDSGIDMTFAHTGVFEDLIDIPAGYGF